MFLLFIYFFFSFFLIPFSVIERRTSALKSPPVDLIQHITSRNHSHNHTYAAASSLLSSSSSPSPSPDSDSDDEFRQVRMNGKLLYDRTMLLGPRPPPSADGSSMTGQGLGYYFITPLVLEEDKQNKNSSNNNNNNNSIIPRAVLLNRGWFSLEKGRSPYQIFESEKSDDTIEVVGLIRKGEAVRRNRKQKKK
jgi:cytochrome oxidase assembly protein ShyY1